MSSEPIIWTGKHRFDIKGSGLHEDTLRIVANYRKGERMLKLVLPTLCITYADMAFQNAVGGMQKNYPASKAYGPVYFDPPVELSGDDIEKYSYIRGAHRVEIGPHETIIEFFQWEELVIPRMRIDELQKEKGAEAVLSVDNWRINVDQPLKIAVKQYADGRHVGGINVEKRHPKYVPPTVKPLYDLWVKVTDGVTQRPLQETIVELWCWDDGAETSSGTGGFVRESHHYTNSDGIVKVNSLPAEILWWFTVRKPGWRIAPRCMRPLAQQSVRLHMVAWRMQGETFKYTWKTNDSLKDLAQFTHFSVQEILKLNHVSSENNLVPGMHIKLPCYQGAYMPENRETLISIAKRFRIKNLKELAAVNSLRDIKSYNGKADLKLPQWLYLHARSGDSLDRIDKQFNLPQNSTIPVHRLYRPKEGALLTGEVVALPYTIR
jgi:hypothetical protein